MISENLTQRIEKIPKEELKIVRIAGELDEDLLNAIKDLREAGFRVSTAPVSGIVPEMHYGSIPYLGLDQIQKFTENYQQTQEIWYPR